MSNQELEELEEALTAKLQDIEEMGEDVRDTVIKIRELEKKIRGLRSKVRLHRNIKELYIKEASDLEKKLLNLYRKVLRENPESK